MSVRDQALSLGCGRAQSLHVDSGGTGPGRISETTPGVGGPQMRTPFERLRREMRPLTLVASTMMQ